MMKLFAPFLAALAVHAAYPAEAGPAGYARCAEEGGSCTMTVPGQVIYGAGATFTAPRLVVPGEEVLCGNARFTDPVIGTVKACWFKANLEAPAQVKPKSATKDAAGPTLATPTNPCGVAAPTTPYWYNDLAGDQPRFQCAPGLSPTSTWPTVRYTVGRGAVAWWYCKSQGVWRPNWVAGTSAFLASTNVANEASAALANADPVPALNLLASRYLNLSLSDPSLTPVWCPHQAEMLAGTPKPDAIVPPATYTVARNGPVLTNPAYLSLAGALGAKTTERATAGAACDCATPTRKAGAATPLYCPFVGGSSPAVVTVCVKSK